VRWSLEEAYQTWGVTTARAAGQRLEIGEFRPMTPVTLAWRDEQTRHLVCTGYIEQIRASVSKDSRAIELQGRSRSVLLRRSSRYTQRQLTHITLQDLAVMLASETGLDIICDVPEDLPLEGQPQIGVSGLDLLRGALEHTLYIAVPMADGRLYIGQPPIHRGEAIRIGEGGSGVISAEYAGSVADRYTSYTYMGQRGAATSQVIIEDRDWTDLDIPLIAVADKSPQGHEDLRGRALREARVTAAKGVSITLEMPRWIDVKRKTVWTPGTWHHVTWPELGVDADLILQSVELRADVDRVGATLTLVPTLLYYPDKGQWLWR